MAISAEHRSKFASVHRQLWRLHMSEKFCARRKCYLWWCFMKFTAFDWIVQKEEFWKKVLSIYNAFKSLYNSTPFDFFRHFIPLRPTVSIILAYSCCHSKSNKTLNNYNSLSEIPESEWQNIKFVRALVNAFGWKFLAKHILHLL